MEGEQMEELGGWLKQKNLKGFLVALSEIVDYKFDSLDWEGVEAGLETGEEDSWFAYSLVGRRAEIGVAISRM